MDVCWMLVLLLVALLGSQLWTGATAMPRFGLDSMNPSSLLASGTYLTSDAKLFTQRVDHYSPLDRRTFQQRYYEFTDYSKGPDAPIFLRICGESACSGITNDFSAVLGELFGATIVALEHRYYGESLVLENFETENLKYLTSQQALFDLAAFRNFYQGEVNKKNNRTGVENSWIVFGGSYSGALSAWFQLKFPHLSKGAVASSGVVLAVLDYTDYDRQVAESTGPVCSDALRQVTADIDAGLQKNATAIKELFGAEQLDVDGDFLYFIADAASAAIQYGNPDLLCPPLEDVYLANGDVLGAYVEFVKDFYVNDSGASIESYDQEKLKDPNNGGRLWWYQVCSEVAFFQTAPTNNSIRSAGLSVQYHLDLCANVFGKDAYPEVDITNLYYGGTGINGSKIVFTNGSQDPWRWASKQTSSPDEPSVLIKCYNCAHVSDMRGCPQSPLQLRGDASKCENPDEVMRAREVIIEYISGWLEIPPNVRQMDLTKRGIVV